MVLLIWIVTLVLLLGWSLTGWALQALLVQGPHLLDALPAWIQGLPYPAVLERWLPNWQELLVAAAGLVQAALGWLGGAGVVLVWIVWAVGAFLLLLVAAVATFAVRRLPRPPAPPTPATTA